MYGVFKVTQLHGNTQPGPTIWSAALEFWQLNIKSFFSV